jgi:hypothetical protein
VLLCGVCFCTGPRLSVSDRGNNASNISTLTATRRLGLLYLLESRCFGAVRLQPKTLVDFHHRTSNFHKSLNRIWTIAQSRLISTGTSTTSIRIGNLVSASPYILGAIPNSAIRPFRPSQEWIEHDGPLKRLEVWGRIRMGKGLPPKVA